MKKILSVLLALFIVAATVSPASAWRHGGYGGYGGGWGGYRGGYYGGYGGGWGGAGAALGLGLGLGLLGGAIAGSQYYNYNYPQVCVNPYNGVRYYCNPY